MEVIKQFLCHWSPVFNAMFSSNNGWKESSESEIKLPGKLAIIFEILVCFCYTKTIPDTKYSTEELIHLLFDANEYQITNLTVAAKNRLVVSFHYFNVLQSKIFKLQWRFNLMQGSVCPESILKLSTFACSDFGYPELFDACKKYYVSHNYNCVSFLFEPEWLKLSLKALKAILDLYVYQNNQEQLLLAVKRWEEANSEFVIDAEMAEVYGKILFTNIRIWMLKDIKKEITYRIPETTKILLWIIKCKRIMETYSTQSNNENEEKNVRLDNESNEESDQSSSASSSEDFTTVDC